MKNLISLVCFLSLATQVSNPHISIRLDNVAEIEELAIYTDTANFFSDVIFQPDGEVLAVIKVDNDLSLVHDGEISFLAVDTFEALSPLTEPVSGTSLAYSPDGSLLAVGDESGKLMVLETETWRTVIEQQVDYAEISDIAIDRTNTFVAVAIGTITTVRENKFAFVMLDIGSGEQVIELEVSDSPEPYGADGTSVSFLNAQMVASTTTDGILRLWDVLTHEQVFQTESTSSRADQIVSQESSQEIAYISGDSVKLVSLAEAAFGSIRTMITAPERNFIRAIVFHPTEPILAIGYERQLQTGVPGARDGIIRLWNIQEGTELVALEGHTDIVTDLAFSPDGTLLASGGADGTVRLWGVAAGE
jgi:WD40 repeat protein